MTNHPSHHAAAASLPADGRVGANPLDPERLLSEIETCGLTGLAERTLQRKRMDGSGPKFVRLGRRVLYRRADVLAWIAANTHASTSAETVAAQRAGRAA